MRKVIRQSVVFPASAEKLSEMHMNPLTHKAITGAYVEIGDKRGSKFKAFDGALTGTILEVIRPRLIIKSWRSVNLKYTKKTNKEAVVSHAGIHEDIADEFCNSSGHFTSL